MLAGIRGGDPWLCFACHSEQLEEAKSDRGEEGLEQGADISKGSEGDVVSDPHLNGVAREKGAPGKRPREGDARAGPVEVSEPWGFCKCDACADRYTGKKDAQSPASK